MSPPEVLLWTRLRLLRGDGPTFRRQHPIGPYCAAARLVVEVDGAHHTEDGQIAKDEARTAYLGGCEAARRPLRHSPLRVERHLPRCAGQE